MGKRIIASGEYLVHIPKGVKESGTIKIPEYSNEMAKDTKSWYYGSKDDIESILTKLPTLLGRDSSSIVEIIWVNTEEFEIGATNVAKYSLIYSTIQNETITHSFCKNLLNL